MLEKSIRILGAYGGKGVDINNTSIQIDKHTTIDAGNILKGIGKDAKYINKIFLTHSHLDHIVDIPFLIDSFFENREIPIKIYALKETINHLKKHLFNWDIWPDFSQINLINKKLKAIEFIEIKVNKTMKFDDFSIKAIKTNHTISSCGYVIKKKNNAIFFTADTYKCNTIWEELNLNKSIKTLIIDVSFPSRLSNIAKKSNHLTLKDLLKELEKLKRDDICIYINHLKPSYVKEIKKEVEELNSKYNIQLLNDGDILNLETTKKEQSLIYENSTKYHLKKIFENIRSKEDFDKIIQKVQKEKEKIK